MKTTIENVHGVGFIFGNASTAEMVTSQEKTMPNGRHPSQFKLFPSSNHSSLSSTSSTYYDASVTLRPSLPYLLFSVFVNLNALSLLPPKVDGQRRRYEIKSKPCGKYIKCNKNVLKKKLKRYNKHENCVLQLQRHCAFFFVLLLVVVMMSFGDAGGIIEEPHYSFPSNKNESTSSIRLSGGLESTVDKAHSTNGYHRNSYLGRMIMYKHILISYRNSNYLFKKKGRCLIVAAQC